MSGIVGVWNFDGAPVQRELLAGMAAAIEHRGPEATGYWIDGQVGMAACLLRVTPESASEVQPVVLPGECACVWDGRLDNRDEILDEICGTSGAGVKPALHHAPDSALVLAAYRRHGEKFAEHLKGDFASGVFDLQRRQLFLARDFLGVRPLYYARSGQTFLFASEIKAILAYPDFSRVPNEDALAVFLAQGISQDESGQTLFSGVYNCPPAHVLAVTPQQILRRRYWSFENVEAPAAKSPGEHVESFRWHFERAVQHRMRSEYPVAVSVSGGLDSSSVFCIAETLRRGSAANHPPILGATLTYPQGSRADEVEYIAAIERQYGLSIVRIPAQPAGDVASQVAQRGIWHTELPLTDAQWHESDAFYRAVAARGSRVVLTGHWGDLVAGEQSHFVDLFNRFQLAELRLRLREFPRWTTDYVPGFHSRQFGEDLLRYYKKYLPRFIVRGLRRLRGRHLLPKPYSENLRRRAREAEWRKQDFLPALPTFHAQSLASRMESKYFLSAFEQDNKAAAMYGLEIAYPFVDRDVLSCVLCAPPQAYSAGAVPRGILRQALRDAVPAEIFARRHKADFTNYINAAVSAQYGGIVTALQGKSQVFQRGYVERKSFAHELERWQTAAEVQGPTCLDAWNLQRLCRLEIWLQTFFGKLEFTNAEAVSCVSQNRSVPAARQ